MCPRSVFVSGKRNKSNFLYIQLDIISSLTSLPLLFICERNARSLWHCFWLDTLKAIVCKAITVTQYLNWLYYTLALICPFCISSATMRIIWFGSMFTVTTLATGFAKLNKNWQKPSPSCVQNKQPAGVSTQYRCCLDALFAYKSHQVGFHSGASYFSQKDLWIDFSVHRAVNNCMVWLTSKREWKWEAAASRFPQASQCAAAELGLCFGTDCFP